MVQDSRFNMTSTFFSCKILCIAVTLIVFVWWMVYANVVYGKRVDPATPKISSYMSNLQDSIPGIRDLQNAIPSIRDLTSLLSDIKEVDSTPTNCSTNHLGVLSKPEVRQRERQKRLADVCRRNPPSTIKFNSAFDTDPDHKLLQCETAKIGSTFWSYIFRFLHLRHKGKLGEYQTPLDIPRVEIHHSVKLETIYRNKYQKVLESKPFTYFFTRDPFSRLWSVYVDKQVTIKTCEGLMNFTHFLIEYGVKEARNPSGMLNPHVRPVSDMCLPCVFRPDYVGSLETFSEDVSYILKKVGYDWVMPPTNRSEHIAHEVSSLIKYNFRVYEQPCDKTKLRLARRLWIVFQINGYINRDIDFPGSDEETYTPQSVIDLVMEVVTKHPLTSKESKGQRNAFKRAAYLGVPDDVIKGVQEKYKMDFEMFGYNNTLDYFFSITEEPLSHHNYSLVNHSNI